LPVFLFNNFKNAGNRVKYSERKEMIFITLAKIKDRLLPTFRQTLAQPPAYLTVHNVFWTLGQYDFIVVYEARNETEAMKGCLTWLKSCETQTLIAITNDEAKAVIGGAAARTRTVSSSARSSGVAKVVKRSIPDKFKRRI
jgi:uncharacterized protein with GYD domain